MDVFLQNHLVQGNTPRVLLSSDINIFYNKTYIKKPRLSDNKWYLWNINYDWNECFIIVPSLFKINSTLFWHVIVYFRDGHDIPVYRTDSCPSNKTEWDKRSSAINCNDQNGYMCMPNEHFTELLEFCYTVPFLTTEKGKCAYIK